MQPSKTPTADAMQITAEPPRGVKETGPQDSPGVLQTLHQPGTGNADNLMSG
ncbi:MAG: hypothetical protein HZA46_24395 [Planctomycetales bacterium]|nr:hypothetical protein [Planctomycetales bacterium]